MDTLYAAQRIRVGTLRGFQLPQFFMLAIWCTFFYSVHLRKRRTDRGRLKAPSTSAITYWSIERQREPLSGEQGCGLCHRQNSCNWNVLSWMCGCYSCPCCHPVMWLVALCCRPWRGKGTVSHIQGLQSNCCKLSIQSRLTSELDITVVACVRALTAML